MIEAVLIVQTVLLLGFAVVLLLVVRQVGVLSLRIGPSGSRTTGSGPDLGMDLSADSFTMRMAEEKSADECYAVLVAFVSPYCAGCQILFPALRAVAREERDHLRVVAVARELSSAAADAARAELGRHVSVVEDEELFERWYVSATPYCVVLDRHGKVAAKGLTHTAEHLESLLTALDVGAPTFDHYLAPRTTVPEQQPASAPHEEVT